MGVVWYRRRHKIRSLEAVNQFPVMVDLADDPKSLSSPLLPDDQSTPSPSTKLEEIDRARQLALSRRPGLVSDGIVSIASGSSRDTRERPLSLIASQSQQSESGSGRRTGDVEAKDVTTTEMAQQIRQLQDQISHLRDQRQSASREHLLEHPPPGYEPDPPTR